MSAPIKLAAAKIAGSIETALLEAEQRGREQGTVDVLSALVWACGSEDGKVPKNYPRMLLALFHRSPANVAGGTVRSHVEFYARKLGIDLKDL